MSGTYQLQDLHADSLERADLLWAAVRVLDAKLERSLSVVGDDVSLGCKSSKTGVSNVY